MSITIEVDGAMLSRLAALYDALPATADMDLVEIHIDDMGRPMAVMAGWTADDGNAEVEYPDADDGLEAAQDYVDDGDWGDGGDTATWIDVRVWRQAYVVDGAGGVEVIRHQVETHSVAVEPDVPACEDGLAHDWQSPHDLLGGCEENPGVWGHGGGVIIREVCAHCGRYRVTDTWSQNMATGEQGLRAVTYEDADADSLAWAAEVAS